MGVKLRPEEAILSFQQIIHRPQFNSRNLSLKEYIGFYLVLQESLWNQSSGLPGGCLGKQEGNWFEVGGSLIP